MTRYVKRLRLIRRRLSCLVRGHRWIGYESRPMALIECSRCGLAP